MPPPLPGVAQLGPLQAGPDGVWLRGREDRPAVWLTVDGLLVVRSGRPDQLTPWSDIEGLGVLLPRLPLGVWWATLPVQALSGPTTSESRQVVLMIAGKDGSNRGLALGRPAEAPYARATETALDAVLQVVGEGHAWARLADSALTGQLIRAVQGQAWLSRSGASLRAELAVRSALGINVPRRFATAAQEWARTVQLQGGLTYDAVGATRVQDRDWSGGPDGSVASSGRCRSATGSRPGGRRARPS